MGDAERADANLIPDFSFQNVDSYYVWQGYLHVQANYLLEIDNIMDLSHTEFLHPTTLGGDGVSNGEYTSRQDGDIVWSIRNTLGDVLPDKLVDERGYPRGSKVDRWMEVRWSAPANMALFAGGAPSGRPRSEGRTNSIGHCFTPESSNSTHYWFSFYAPRQNVQAFLMIATTEYNDVQSILVFTAFSEVL